MLSALAQLFCMMIGHRRSARRAYLDASEHRWCSYCRHCGAPMQKAWPHGWRVKKAAA